MAGKQSRTIGLSLIIALVLGLGGWWAVSGQGPSPEQPTPSPTSPSRPTASPAAPGETPLPVQASHDGTRVWSPGTLYRYELTSDQQVTFRPAQPGAAVPPGMRFMVQGQWEVGVVSAGAERVDLRVLLRPATFSVNVDGQDALTPEVRSQLQASLGTSFFVSLDREGRVKLTHFEQGTDVLVQGLLRSFVASTQFVVPGKPGAAWETEEYDSTGQYAAAYRRLDGSRFEKSKKAYSRLASPQGLVSIGQDVHLEVRAQSTFELAEDLWPHSVQAREELTLDAGGGTPPASTSLQLALRLLGRGRDASLSGALLARQATLMTLPMASVVGQEQDPMDGYRQVLGGRRFEDMLKDLRSLPTTEKERDDARTLALERLRALFKLQPAEALKVPDALRSGLDPVAASPLIGALSAASTPEALQALSRSIDDSTLQPIVRTDAIAAMGMADVPNREGVDTLRRYSQDANPLFRDTATLALGNASLQMQDDDARGADALLNELMNAYRTASTPEQQALVLRALGNTRSPRALPVIREALRSGSPLVREAAVVALRNIPDPSVDQLLAERLSVDPAPEVRKSAVFSCGFRPLAPLLPAFQKLLQTDPADAVRAEAVTLLGANRATLPLVDTLLTWTSQNDRSPDIRNIALSFLQPSGRPLPSP
jgi:HEAT repeat protein